MQPRRSRFSTGSGPEHRPELALTAWARGHRFAGSGDRAGIRDLVFDVLRRWRSSAELGGGETGRARVIGLLRGQGRDPSDLFTGEGHAPPPLSPEEARSGVDLSEGAALDLPDWLLPDLRASLGQDFATVAATLRDRAPVGLRVNLLRADPASRRPRSKRTTLARCLILWRLRRGSSRGMPDASRHRLRIARALSSCRTRHHRLYWRRLARSPRAVGFSISARVGVGRHWPWRR